MFLACDGYEDFLAFVPAVIRVNEKVMLSFPPTQSKAASEKCLNYLTEDELSNLSVTGIPYRDTTCNRL